jgi:hypothetical protein
MAEDWQLRQLERRFDRLEEGLARDRERAREEKEQARGEKRWRVERINDWLFQITWTAGIATLFTCILWW